MKAKFKKIIKFIKSLTGDNVSVYAAQASFFLVISAIPFLLLVFTIMKLFIDIDQSSVIHAINAFAPSKISALLTTVAEELLGKTASIPVISVSAVSALWLASKGVMALRTGLDSVYGVEPRNYFLDRLFSLLYTLAFIAALILTILFFGFSSNLERLLYGHSKILSLIIDIFLRTKIIVFMVYLTLVFALFYRFLPKAGNRFKEQLPGAAFSAAGWMIFSFIYSIYIENFSNYSYVYGSLAAVVLLMLWLYFCMNIFLYGAQINKIYKNALFKK